ncbi:glycosyltransferase family 2 protein [Anaeromyxobacter sp. Fw109-5]|uniref:glycosyltransferase family 2 protein n=1 Tax=Anaeromyxobacter sp. (strain Fw109-5) TaxID=404589 RepID=UPI000158A699|nr:glycosyltransferase family 2 protein [Anaeromyxobacter sp. Fw109-5]ABS26024.1 glycosyl transferase family 2 [Anaeromyxobacter sp. Fw109-5]
MMLSENARILVVMPAFNEARQIRRVVEAVRGQVAGDVLVVDDGSRDETAGEARRGGAVVATHPVNLGYGAALQTGYRYALRHGYDAVLQLDADGQHDPASIPPLLRALERADVVVGSRFLDGDSYRPPLLRRLGMWLFGSVASALSGQRITDPTSGFQAISREALHFYSHERYPVDYPDADVLAMVARSGLRLTEVPVRMLPSPPGKSMHGGFIKPFYYVFRMSLALFFVPLRSEKR